MKDSKVIDIIELYVRDLEYSYRVAKRTSEILVLSNKEREIVEEGIASIRETIDAIKKCSTIEEVNQYVKVKKMVKAYKETYEDRKRELYE